MSAQVCLIPSCGFSGDARLPAPPHPPLPQTQGQLGGATSRIGTGEETACQGWTGQRVEKSEPVSWRLTDAKAGFVPRGLRPPEAPKSLCVFRLEE